MKRIAVPLLLALAVSSQADITAMSAPSQAGVGHNDVSTGPNPIFGQTATGLPLSLSSPLTQSNPGTMSYLSQASINAAETTSTPTFWQYDAYYAADVEVSGTPNGVMTGNCRATITTFAYFNLDAPGTVTFRSYNSLLQTSVSSQWANAGAGKAFWLDNVLISFTYGDSLFSINVGAGAHSLEATEDATSIFTSGSGNFEYASTYATSRTRITISSVPEPSTIAALALGLAVVVRRKRRAA